MIVSPYTRRGKIKIQASKLWVDFWIWDNWLKSNHFTLDNHPFSSHCFRLERIEVADTLYMCAFTKSQIYQNMAKERISYLFRKADRLEPVFISMRRFRELQRQCN